MGLSKLKNKLFHKSSGAESQYVPEIIGAPKSKAIHTKHSSSRCPPPSSEITGTSAAGKSGMPWMPVEPLTEPLPPSSTENASETTRTNELTEKEKKLEKSMGVSDAEKEAAAEERRAYVRAYMRNNRDINRWKMYGA